MWTGLSVQGRLKLSLSLILDHLGVDEWGRDLPAAEHREVERLELWQALCVQFRECACPASRAAYVIQLTTLGIMDWADEDHAEPPLSCNKCKAFLQAQAYVDVDDLFETLVSGHPFHRVERFETRSALRTSIKKSKK